MKKFYCIVILLQLVEKIFFTPKDFESEKILFRVCLCQNFVYFWQENHPWEVTHRVWLPQAHLSSQYVFFLSSICPTNPIWMNEARASFVLGCRVTWKRVTHRGVGGDRARDMFGGRKLYSTEKWGETHSLIQYFVGLCSDLIGNNCWNKILILIFFFGSIKMWKKILYGCLIFWSARVQGQKIPTISYISKNITTDIGELLFFIFTDHKFDFISSLRLTSKPIEKFSRKKYFMM